MIADRQLQILKLFIVFEFVRNIRCNVQDVLDPVLVQIFEVRRVLGVSEVEVRKDLDGKVRRVVRRNGVDVGAQASGARVLGPGGRRRIR